eukprot:Phypoly_transcript_05995.p2 GENE.Phypoly_transcript_05995~~Phypoly_transcript_05995.p2  ORF type:complete len:129 (-),score=24.44 Phypoly_transcript_05995:1382-1768(-)
MVPTKPDMPCVDVILLGGPLAAAAWAGVGFSSVTPCLASATVIFSTFASYLFFISSNFSFAFFDNGVGHSLALCPLPPQLKHATSFFSSLLSSPFFSSFSFSFFSFFLHFFPSTPFSLSHPFSLQILV